LIASTEELPPLFFVNLILGRAKEKKMVIKMANIARKKRASQPTALELAVATDDPENSTQRGSLITAASMGSRSTMTAKGGGTRSGGASLAALDTAASASNTTAGSGNRKSAANNKLEEDSDIADSEGGIALSSNQTDMEEGRLSQR
jgi:acyl-coenzyme A thioesterase PaaI-like protein